MGEAEGEAMYESSDYSQDGQYIVLQRATEGTGIPVVFMGDGFVDTHMGEGGLYEQRMKEGMEHFFSEEPYKTFRNKFTVYAVKAVSKNEGVRAGSSTIFGTHFGEGTRVGGNDDLIYTYAARIPEITTFKNLTIINIVNSPRYAGTCYMAYPSNSSVSYCTIIDYNAEQFRRVLVHEAGGHGFAKLADEYQYDGTLPAENVAYFNTQSDVWGWYENVDVTPDQNEIKWSNFLKDDRYKGLVGIYEGAFTYTYGAWRPTDESIMRHNIMGFNAPSRLAIYKRIMEQSGEGYTYEKFLEYDAMNRSASASAALKEQAAGFNKDTFIPFAPPVIVTKTPNISK